MKNMGCDLFREYFPSYNWSTSKYTNVFVWSEDQVIYDVSQIAYRFLADATQNQTVANSTDSSNDTKPSDDDDDDTGIPCGACYDKNMVCGKSKCVQSYTAF